MAPRDGGSGRDEARRRRGRDRSREASPAEDYDWLGDLRDAAGVDARGTEPPAGRNREAAPARRGEPRRTEPRHDGPRQVETRQAPPRRAEPARTEPRRAEPVEDGWRRPLGALDRDPVERPPSAGAKRWRPRSVPAQMSWSAPPTEGPADRAPRRPTPRPRGTASAPANLAEEPTVLGAHMRRQMERVSRLRKATIALVILVVFGAPVAFFAIREFTRDPIFVELDGLDVPDWAASNHTDGALGSRWCIKECRTRQRTWESARGPDETNRAYSGALRRAGWLPWDIPNCQAEDIDGIATCWQRDEYVLDLWVRPAVCEVKATRPTIAPSPGTVAASAPPAPSPTAVCPVSIATVKVYNRISYEGAAAPK